MREYRYVLVDVFTEVPLLGNQLAVFTDAEGLSAAEMQALARETNLSETTFCFPREPADGVRVRIFTTEEELPFAGHPTLGTATVLRWVMPALHRVPQVRLQLNTGVVPVTFTAAPGEPSGEPKDAGLVFGHAVRAEMQQALPRWGRRHDPAAVARALGLPADALDADHPIETVSTGVPFVVVLLRSVQALGTFAIERQEAEQYLRHSDGKFFYVLAPGSDATHWRARMQFYNGEDPATGSAAGCATAWLVRHGLVPQGARFTIEQGIEIGRRSVIECRAVLREAEGSTEKEQYYATGSYLGVGGSTIAVAEGRFFLR